MSLPITPKSIQKSIRDMVERETANIMGRVVTLTRLPDTRNIPFIPLPTRPTVGGKRKNEEGTQTMTKKQRMTGKYATHSLSKGKLVMRKARKTKYTKVQRRGHVISWERNTVFDTTQQVAYVGHHTHPIANVRYEMWAGLLKKLCHEMKVYPSSRAQLLAELNIQVGDIFEVEYRTSPVSPVLVNQYVVAAGNIFNSLIAHFGDQTRPWFGTTEQNQPVLEKLSFVPATVASPGYTELDLKCTYVKILSKSHLKIQNRTVNTVEADGNEADDIDNMPLHGKGYMVNSNQARIFGAQGVEETIIASTDSGIVFTSSGSGADDLPQEVPLWNYFQKVKGTGKLHLDPGEIKTSTVTATLSGSVNSILNKLNGISNLVNRRVLFGKMKFFAIEKMINSNVLRPISLAMELNTSLYTTVTAKLRTAIKPEFFISTN